jgi:hypothetical protein
MGEKTIRTTLRGVEAMDYSHALKRRRKRRARFVDATIVAAGQ